LNCINPFVCLFGWLVAGADFVTGHCRVSM